MLNIDYYEFSIFLEKDDLAYLSYPSVEFSSMGFSLIIKWMNFFMQLSVDDFCNE